MYKFLLSMPILIIFLYGCSNDEKTPDSVWATEEESHLSDQQSKSVSLESQIESLMAENDFNFKTIIDYDIKGDYIFVVALESNTGLQLALLRNNAGQLEWIDGGNEITGLSDKDSLIAYIFKKENDMDDVKEVRVFGESAKSVIYYEQFTDDFTREVQYWIIYTDKQPGLEDIEYIRD